MHVIINGVSSETLQGVQVLSLPPITKPRMRTSVAVIDGRPGDIVTRLGYEAYNRKIRILLHHNYDIDAISAFFNTSGTIIFSNEPDMEYEFETIDAFSFERAVRYKTADITFHVQPYKLSATEQPATGEVSTLVDRTPYIIRRTPFGTRQKGSIVGGSVAWNQLSQTTRAAFATHGLTYVGEDGKTTVTGTFTGGTGSAARFGNSNKAIPAGHKVALLGGKSDTWFLRLQGMTYTPTKGNDIINATDGALADIVVRPNLATNTEVNETFYFQIIDLTLMFGPTIADYIYTQEQATAGAGVALAKAWAGIIADYYPYDAGSIKSVEGLTAHRMTGKNLLQLPNVSRTFAGVTISASGEPRIVFDGTTDSSAHATTLIEHYPMLPGDYILNGAQNGDTIGIQVHNATKNKTYRDVGNGAHFTVDEGDDIAIRVFAAAGTSVSNMVRYPMIRFADVQDATFEPYTVYSYPLDSSLTLRGLPKLDGDSIYYDGDVYKADGTVERMWTPDVSMSTLAWKKNGSDPQYYASVSGFVADRTGATIKCNKYVGGDAYNKVDKTVCVTGTNMWVYDSSYTTLADFTASLSDAKYIAKLATPTTEQAEPYTELQVCDPAGTEEFVGASMPVGHDTTYIDPISMTVTNEGNTESAPSITIEGEGAVEVTVDGLNILQIQMPASGEITIDSKTLDAMNGEGGLANRSVTGDYNDLRLTPGEHTVTVTGDVTSVTLNNASRWI